LRRTGGDWQVIYIEIGGEWSGADEPGNGLEGPDICWKNLNTILRVNGI